MPGQKDETRARLGVLSQAEWTRLTGVLARLSSSHDGERAAAALLASAFVKRHGLAWTDVVASLQPVRGLPAGPIVPPAMPERRSTKGQAWRGYCRRRLAAMGRSLNWLG